MIHALAPSFNDGCGFQRTLATGKLGISSVTSTQSTLLTIKRNLLPISINEAATAGPEAPLNTKRAGSSLPPIPSGCTSITGLVAASVGHISSMCAQESIHFLNPCYKCNLPSILYLFHQP